jgi:hypothetical protein
MYIITGDDNIKELREKYIVLELDTFNVNDVSVPTYCVVDSTCVGLADIGTLNSHKQLHENLIKNYKIGNWNFCDDAITHLYGKFNGELDSFYDAFKERVSTYKKCDLPNDWTGVISK